MHAVVVTTLSLLLSCVSAQEQLRMTLLSINHFDSEANGEYQCHLSETDTSGTTVTSFRAVKTRNKGIRNNPVPPSAVYQGNDTYPHYKVTLDGKGNDKWFGVFGCEATRTGKIVTRISTTRMRSDADLVPANKLFTQTVNIGDEGVSITMFSPSEKDTRDIRWRKNGGKLISSQEGSATFSIARPIEINDKGTYECHIQGQRDMAKQGLNLLLVRACPANRWGPPTCTGVCNSCYNGGLCDENNGECVCPPGFMGDNCLQACGGNRYGHSCEIQCPSSNETESCRTYLFCLIHPFGCRCYSGWEGLACDSACQTNTFGASCLESCHCKSNTCNSYTGKCTGSDNSCKRGWTGDNCQECDGNFFGTDCTQECRCSKEYCNRESGLCKPGGCLPLWVDLYRPYSCQTGLENITYTKMNPEIPVPVTCRAVRGPEEDLSSLQLVLSKDSENLEDDEITADDISQDGTTRSFIAINVHQGEMLHCQLRNSGGKLVALSVSVDFFVLPVLTSAPVNDSVGPSSVTISWSAWDEIRDVGDPPLVGYIAYYKITGNTGWMPGERISPHTLNHTFTGMDPETLYSFSVSAVRQGEGGEGPRSHELSVRTVCDVPLKPEAVTAEISGEVQENIEVSWQLPSNGTSCSSGVIKFTVYYSWGTNFNSVDVSDPSATSVFLHDVTPGVAYKLYVTLSTSGGESEMSNEIIHIVPVLPSLTNPPMLPDITCNSVTMVWAKWTEGRDEGTPPITHYIPYYKMHVAMEWIRGEEVHNSNEDYKPNITFSDLTEDTSYDFRVVPVRGGYGGEGNSTEVVQGNTTSCFVGGGASPVVIGVSTTLSVLLILLIILAAVLIVRRRERKKPLDTLHNYETTGTTNNSYEENIHGPVIISKNDEQRKEHDDNEALYTNLEKPVSIMIADFEEYMDDCDKRLSAKLEQQFQLLKGDRQFASHMGHKEQNKTKNRFKNMIAYDHSRVVLETINGDPHSDYYNANYIKVEDQKYVIFFCPMLSFLHVFQSHKLPYINKELLMQYLSEGPNKASVGDFWRMVWKENVCNIIMLTNLMEDGKLTRVNLEVVRQCHFHYTDEFNRAKQDRCIQYWPSTVGASRAFGKIIVKLESDEQFGDYNIRRLQVEMAESIRTVTNWHFKTWPDKDIPDQPSPLIEFGRRIKTYQTTAPGHLLVHCSAGVGRTGTFIALYTLMDVMETDTKIDIYGYVERMRQDRIQMVQTGTQYKFLHECLLEILLTGNTKIPVKNMASFDIQAEKENLKRQFKILAKLDKRSASLHTATPEESEKSRYPKIMPVEKRRPFLQTPGKTSNSNYINACFVTSYKKKNAFIATQSPLPNTVEDFWRLVYDWKCPFIVMLNQLDPSDKTCCKYWPENASSRFGNMSVMLKEEKNVGIYVHRQFELTDGFNQEPRLVHQLQLNSWDERKQQDLTIFIRDMNKIQQDYSMVAPAVVHCINGVGRTGVILTVNSEMERLTKEGTIDVFNTVRQLRGSNRSMVYTKEDYYLCHQLLKLEFPESFYANI